MDNQNQEDTGPYVIGTDGWVIHQGMRHLLIEMKKQDPETLINAANAMAKLAEAQAILIRAKLDATTECSN